VEALYSTYLEPIRRLCRSYVNEDTVAEDATQEAFKRTLERRNTVGFRRHPRRFLFGEARRICLEYLRQRQRETVALRVLLTQGDDPVDVVGESLELRDHVDQLTEPQKAVLAHIFAGYEVKEIARRVGWPYGTVASRLGRLRDTARRREEQLRALGLIWLARRQRWRLDPMLGQHATVVWAAVAVFLAGPAPAATASTAAAAPAVASAVTAATAPADKADARTAGPAGARQIAGWEIPRTTAPVQSAPAAPRHQLLTLLPTETPEDTDVTAITPSPHYGQDHTVVALGLGHACACPVLLRSTDGGASWDSTAVAATGDQVVLPPDYPADPRIFIGTEPSATSVDWVSPGWGQPFTPLPLPPAAAGHLAIVDGQLLSVGSTTVWSLRAASSVAVPVLAYSGQIPTIAASADAAYILAPAHAIGGGVSTGTEPGLFVCTSECRYVGSVPLPGVGPLAVNGATVVAAAGSAVVLSQDGGAAFQTISPAGAAQLPSADAVAVSSLATWVVGQAAAHMRPASSGRWQPVALNQVRELVPLSATRLIATLRLAGLRCSTDGGATWTSRCAPEP
jgi:RNA polymerase sigma factor (sigma-70 family)